MAAATPIQFGGSAIRFSVVVPTFDRPEFVVNAVRSVLDQTYPAHEVIVVVDGGAIDVADRIRQSLPTVKVLVQPNLGVSVARNHAIAVASGDWIAFLDDDDLWHRDKLRVVADYLAKYPECQALNHPLWYFSESADGPREGLGLGRDFVASTLRDCLTAADRIGLLAEERARHLQVRGSSMELFFRKDRGMTSGTLVRRDTLIRAGMFPPMQSENEDWTMFVNVSRLGEWHTIPMRLGFNRLHSGQNIAGSIAQSLFSLCGTINAWYTGRPLRSAVKGIGMLATLASYGPVYRKAVQGFHWAALRSGNLAAAGRIRTAGKLLLPRWQDYLYALIPPPLTWRWERYVLGMHRSK